IQLLQLLHQTGAYVFGRHLALGALLQLRFDSIRNRLELLDTDGPLFRGGQQSGNEFLPLKRFTVSVFLDHAVFDVLEPLTARESLAAVETLAPATNDVPFFALARVDDLIAKMAAIRALHRAPFSASRTSRAPSGEG